MVDLRQIPIIIGGLYFDYGPFITFLSLLFRGLYYGFDSSFWTVLPLYITLAIFLRYTHPWFLKQNSRKRLSIALTTAVIMNTLIFIGLLISGHSIYGLTDVVITTVIQCIGIFMVSYLIEEIKQSKFLRDQMAQAQKIELVSHMSSAISHEVRNPLTSVGGFLQLVLEDRSIQEIPREYINIALTELKAAENVIKDYLTIAEPSMETIENSFQQMNLSRLLSPCNQLLI